MITYRKYSGKDLDYIVSKQSQLSQHHCQYDKDYYKPSINSKEEFKKYISNRINDNDFNITLAESNEIIVGYAMGWIELRPPIYDIRKIGYFSNMFVDNHARMSGIGKNLFTEMEKWFKSKNVDYIELKCDSRNDNSIKKFRDYGYKVLSLTFYIKT